MIVWTVPAPLSFPNLRNGASVFLMPWWIVLRSKSGSVSNILPFAFSWWHFWEPLQGEVPAGPSLCAAAAPKTVTPSLTAVSLPAQSSLAAHLVSLERQHRQLFLGQPFFCNYLHSVWIKLVPLSLFVAWLHFCLWTTVFQLPTSVKYPVGLSPGDRRQQNHVLLSVFGLPDMHMTSPRAVNHVMWLATQGDVYLLLREWRVDWELAAVYPFRAHQQGTWMPVSHPW